MEATFLSAPSGFNAAMDWLNASSSEELRTILLYAGNRRDRSTLSAAQCSALNAVEYVFRGAEQHDCEDLPAALTRSTELRPDAAKAIGSAWELSKREDQAGLSMGSLVDLDWKLGVAVRSNQCKKLAAPYVGMVLKVADSEGKVKAHSMELSVPEFFEFSTKMERLHAMMDQL